MVLFLSGANDSKMLEVTGEKDPLRIAKELYFMLTLTHGLEVNETIQVEYFNLTNWLSQPCGHFLFYNKA